MTSIPGSASRYAQLDELLFQKYGSYLRTVRHHSQQDHLCPICGGIKNSNYKYCVSCANLGLAEHTQTDRLAFGFYAVEENHQFYTVMHDYKEPVVQGANASRNNYRALISLILRVQVAERLSCIARLANAPVTAWAVIPSSQQSKRSGQRHPLAQIVQQTLPRLPEVTMTATRQKERGISDHEFAVSMQSRAPLNHVLLIDDSWVTGGSVQSAALALKKAGAGQVSAYCIARIVRQNYLARQLGNEAVRNFYQSLCYQRFWCPWHDMQHWPVA